MKYTGWCQNDSNVQGYTRRVAREVRERDKGLAVALGLLFEEPNSALRLLLPPDVVNALCARPRTPTRGVSSERGQNQKSTGLAQNL